MDVAPLPLIGIRGTTVAPTAELADLRAELARHHADAVGWARACCGFDHGEAGDVLQDAYLKVLDGRAVFGQQSMFRTWLFGVIRRTAAEHRRRDLLRRLVTWGRPEVSRLADGRPDPSDEAGARDALHRLRRSLGRLPLRQREVLHLVFQQDLTIEAAAEVMGVSLGTARTHYARGKARLRELLGSERP